MPYQLHLENVKCGGCANTIRRLVNENCSESLQGVIVDPASGLVTLAVETLNEDTLLAIKSALSKAGYPEVGNANTLGNKVQSFVSCAIGRLEKP